MISYFDDGESGVSEIHARARSFEETRSEGNAEILIACNRLLREHQRGAESN